MNRPLTFFVASFLIGSILLPKISKAYQTGTVSAKDSVIKASPDDSAPSLESLPKGAPLNLSDKSTNGYYKASSRRSLGWIKVGSVVVTKTQAPTRNLASVQSKNQLLWFRVANLFAVNSLSVNNTGILQWSPIFQLGDSKFSLRPQLGFTVFKAASSFFLVPEFLLLGGYQFNQRIVLEAGGGIQAWLIGSSPSLYPLIQVQGVYALNELLFSKIRSLFAGVGLSLSSTPTWQIRAGIETVL